MHLALRRIIAACMALLLAMTLLPPRAAQAGPADPALSGPPCPSGAPERAFRVFAIAADMVYNKYGLHDPYGKMYVLSENKEAVLHALQEGAGQTASVIQPLAIRANLGDCIVITFVNELPEYASMHPTGISHAVIGPNGIVAGQTTDGMAAPFTAVTYRWYPEKEGVFFFDSDANPTFNTDPGEVKGSRNHGLFGAMVVEPPGATWTDRRTGAPLASGVQADIHPVDDPSFREIVIFYHDGAETVMSDNSHPVDLNGELTETYNINYRAEPEFLRLREDCPDCPLRSQFYSSWVHGDPGGGDLVFPVYVNDPVKFRIVGAQVEENHVHHLHVHRWKAQPDDPESNTIDSQTLGPGSGYTADLTGGAGYVHGTAGDVLFHCHLFPHYFLGMWAILRVQDKAQPDLLPLPDRAPKPAPTEESPGYPGFIPGSPGLRAPHPPDVTYRPPTPAETAHFPNMVPGAPNTDPCPTSAPTREYEISAVQLDLPLNRYGDRLPGGRILVPKADDEAVTTGAKPPEPLIMRANKGDCVQITLSNHFPPVDEQSEVSMHVHYVAFDVLGSDGTAIGFNYDQGVKPGETIRYRWYADEEGSIFTHDHQSGSAKRGTYGMLAVEPTGSQWLDPADLTRSVTTGTRAVIVPPDQPAFRELAVMYSDQVAATDAAGVELEPQSAPGTLHDHGVMTMNYRNAPLYRRGGGDTAHVFSSWVNGDPDTPILEAYPGERMRIRLIQGSMEEMHGFGVHGLPWQRDATDPYQAAESVGVSEYFNFDMVAPAGEFLERDYLYGSMAVDDLWNGLWSYIRTWGKQVPWLPPLPGTPGLADTAAEGELAPFKEPPGTLPAAQPTENNPCPTGAPIRSYDLTAFTAGVGQNRYGDHDPHGVVFAPSEDEAAITEGTKSPEPLVLRANVGDCITVTLLNHLPAQMAAHTDHAGVAAEAVGAGLPTEEVEAPEPALLPSSRISLHPQLVSYDVQTADGAAVGFNADSTVGPGESRTYRWYADREVGATVLWDMADIRNHRHHGAYGMLIIEPEGAAYRNPVTGQPLTVGPSADILLPDGTGFREYAVMFADGAYSQNADGTCPITDADAVPGAPCNRQGDPEDQGQKLVNHRSAPFTRRLGAAQNAGEPVGERHTVMSSAVHGDPDTPVFRANVGDPVRFRLVNSGDKPRTISFSLDGHLWQREWPDLRSPWVGTQRHMAVGMAANIVPLGGAGGPRALPGDYVYGDQKLRNYLEGGMWGLFRVLPAPQPDLIPLPQRPAPQPLDPPPSPNPVITPEKPAEGGSPDAGGPVPVPPVQKPPGIESAFDAMGESATQPVAVDGVIYHVAGWYLWRYDPRSGEPPSPVLLRDVAKDMRTASEGFGRNHLTIRSTPTYSEESGMLYFATAEGRVWAYDTVAGRRAESKRLQDYRVSGCPVLNSPAVIRKDGRDLVVVADSDANCAGSRGGAAHLIWGLDDPAAQRGDATYTRLEGSLITPAPISVPARDSQSPAVLLGAQWALGPCFGEVHQLQIVGANPPYSFKHGWTYCQDEDSGGGFAGNFSRVGASVFWVDTAGRLFGRLATSGEVPSRWESITPLAVGRARAFTNTETALDPETNTLYVTLRNYTEPADPFPLRGCPDLNCSEPGAPGAVVAVEITPDRAISRKWLYRMPHTEPDPLYSEAVNTAPLILKSQGVLLFGDVNGNIRSLGLDDGQPRPFMTGQDCIPVTTISVLPPGTFPVRGDKTDSRKSGVGTNLVMASIAGSSPLLVAGANWIRQDGMTGSGFVTLKLTESYNLGWTGDLTVDRRSPWAPDTPVTVTGQIRLANTTRTLGDMLPGQQVRIGWYLAGLADPPESEPVMRHLGDTQLDGSLTPDQESPVSFQFTTRAGDPQEGYLLGVIDPDSVAFSAGPAGVLARSLVSLAGRIPVCTQRQTEVRELFGPAAGSLAPANLMREIPDNFGFAPFQVLQVQALADVAIRVEAPPAVDWTPGGSYAVQIHVTNRSVRPLDVPVAASVTTAQSGSWSLGTRIVSVGPGQTVVDTRSVSMIRCSDTAVVRAEANPDSQAFPESKFADNAGAAATALGPCDSGGGDPEEAEAGRPGRTIIVMPDCEPETDPASRKVCKNYPLTWD